MYDNIGGKIKGLAKAMFIFEAIGAVITGFVLCTADDDFHNNAWMVEDADALLAIEHINMNLFKQFSGIHDEVCLLH